MVGLVVDFDYCGVFGTILLCGVFGFWFCCAF